MTQLNKQTLWMGLIRRNFDHVKNVMPKKSQFPKLARPIKDISLNK